MVGRIICILVTLLLCVSIAWGRMGVMVVGGTPSSSIPTPSFSSTFEDATDRSQWTTFGTFNLDYSSSGLDMVGSYVARLDTSATVTRTVTSSSKGTIIFKWRMPDAPESSEQVVRFLNSGDTVLCTLQITSSSATPYATDGTLNQGTTGQTSTSINTSVWLRLTYEAGTGSNDGKCNASKWNGSQWVIGTSQITTSTKTDNIAKIRAVNFFDGSGTEYQYFDNIFYFTSIVDVDPTLL